MSSLTFYKFQINSFGGINKDNPIILDLSEYYSKGKNIGLISGDMGVGKTSFLNSLLYSAAYNFDFKIENFVNLKDGTINGERAFEKDKKQYKIKFTKSKFELLRLFRDGEDERWIPESNPKTLVKELIGNVGTSPMPLKEAKGEDQVKWLYSMLNVSKEVLDRESKLKSILDEAVNGRKTANKEYDRLNKILSEEPMYLNWEESEKKYKEEKNIESAKKKFAQLSSKKELYNKSKTTLENINEQLISKQKEIIELETKLQLLKSEKQNLEIRKEEGEKYLINNKHIITDFESAQNELLTINQYIVEQSKWQAVKKYKKEMDEYETLVQQFDVRKDNIRKELRGLVHSLLPDVEGLEVITDNSIEGKEPGVYLNNKTIAQLSESELWQFFFKLCQAKKTTMVVIENISSLGSDAINTLNELAKHNVYVWATEMKRGQKEIKIEFVDEIK